MSIRPSDWAGLNMTQDYNHRDRNDHLYQTWNDEQKNYAKYLNNDFIHDNKQHIYVLNTKEFNYVMLNCISTYLHKKRLCNIELHTSNKYVYQVNKRTHTNNVKSLTIMYTNYKTSCMYSVKDEVSSGHRSKPITYTLNPNVFCEKLSQNND